MDDIIPQNIRSENSNDVVDGSVHKFPDVTDIFCDENNDILHKKKCENIEREKSKKCDKIKNYKDFVKTVSKLVNFDKKDNKTESSMRKIWSFSVLSQFFDLLKTTLLPDPSSLMFISMFSVSGSSFIKNSASVGKLVNFDKKDNKTESSMRRRKEKPKDKKTSKSSNKKGEGGNIMRNTRSSSRSAKVHAEEKLSVKTKKEKNTKLNTSKQNL
jgi:hypothetical protein